MRTVWVLNLDAEEELAARGRYQASARVLEVARGFAERARPLLGPEDCTLEEFERAPGESAEPWLGRCWCPTPSALARLARAGVAAESAPSLGVLRRVNSRAFCAELGQSLPGATWVTTTAEALAALAKVHAAHAAHGGPVRLKRAFGAAGRGQRTVRAGTATDEERAWIAAACAGGGLQLEPCVELVREFALHGWLDAPSAHAAPTPVRWGRSCVQEVDARGAWSATRPAAKGELAPAEAEALTAEGRRVAEALRAAGYFGPFGLDAYRWIDAAGRTRFCARSEINARYSMGWPVGWPAAWPTGRPGG